ncbi:hypothetical protein I316_02635 [Kwoniella heveanensis BCC8398]|uniref:Small secreted protein n=1 Tax=Kwoniella heveanensis BCC8398 TaxID=1296120 RepID=A0A1B9GX37_9TREE|nr:hypothetical protein I316_02635 [Kwoniella heveanensis BCC8398]
MIASKLLFVLLPLLFSVLVRARPQGSKRQGGQCPTFALQDYADFQISDGVAGDAEAQANAVFVDPFAGCDLSTVDDASLENIKTMREAAEDAETELFNPQIEAAASEAEADALQVGKIKNKVLKLTGFSQALRIEIAQGGGADRQSKLDEEDGKLAKNIATDVDSAGAASQAAVGEGGAGGNAANVAAVADADDADADESETADEEVASSTETASGSTCTCAN